MTITPHVWMTDAKRKCAFCKKHYKPAIESAHCDARLQDAKNRAAIRGVSLAEYLA